MSLPKSVQVGPVQYTVKMAAHLGATHDENGVTNTWAATIDIGADLHPDQQRLTMLHELCHACWNCAHEPEKHDEKYTQETALRILTPTLLHVLRTNPEVIAYLLEGAR